MPSSYWWARGLFGEIRRWLDHGLGRTSGATSLRALALLLDGHLTISQGDTEAGMKLVDEGEHVAEHLGARVVLALAAHTRGVVSLYSGDLPAAIEAFERTVAMVSAGRPPEPGREMELRLSAPVLLGIATALSGDHDRADACYRDVLALTEPVGERHFQSLARWPLALAAWRQGRTRAADEQLRAGLRLRTVGSANRFSAAQCLEGLAWIAASRRQHFRAAVLLGAAEALWASTGIPVTGFQHLIGYHDACEQQTRTALGEAAFTEAIRRGADLSYEDAISYALDEPPRPRPAPAAPAPASLTRREQQVADLITQGLSNQEIATELVIFRRTAESHVERILAKLGLANRAQVAARMAARVNGSKR